MQERREVESTQREEEKIKSKLLRQTFRRVLKARSLLTSLQLAYYWQIELDILHLGFNNARRTADASSFRFAKLDRCFGVDLVEIRDRTKQTRSDRLCWFGL